MASSKALYFRHVLADLMGAAGSDAARSSGGGANSPVGMVLAIGEGGRCLDCYVTYFTV